MDLQLVFLIGVILILSAIQSVMGVGILLFGTPTLLLLGYSYVDTLSLILPASIVISFFQVRTKMYLVQTKTAILVYTLPAIILSLSLIILFELSVDIKKIVGVMLIFVGLVRYSDNLKNILNDIVVKYKSVYCLFMGGVHGVSNMGGGLLVVLMGVFFKDKDAVRANVAFGYLLFGIVQVLVLLSFNGGVLTIDSAILAIVSLLTYLFVGSICMNRINENNYHSLITVLVFVYGLASFVSL